MKEYIAELILKGVQSVYSDIESEHGKIRKIFHAIWRYPLKSLAAFIFSPVLSVILIYRLAKQKNRASFIRIGIGIAGMVLAIICSYLIGTVLGSFTAALFIMTNIGVLAGAGFIFGTAFSIYFTVIIQIIIFNFISTVFLKINSDDVIKYLNEQITE